MVFSSNTKRMDLDSTVERFEHAWSVQGNIQIEDFVEPSAHNYPEVLCELIRVEMELRWAENDCPKVEEYLTRFLNAGLDSSHIAELAFEEYRIRFQHGEDVQPPSYSERFGIDITEWPTWDRDTDRPPGRPNWNSGDADLRHLMPSVGDSFHGYELVALLGNGAFGAVFLGRETGLSNRLVAVKVTEKSDLEPQSLAKLQHTNIIPIYSLKQDDSLQTICMPFFGVATLRDLCLQAKIEDEKPGSDSLAKITGVALISTVSDKKANTIAISIETPDSNTIQSEIKCNHLSERVGTEIEGLDFGTTALWLAGRIANGLAYAHDRGIVHGDLKPENVLISDDGEPLILDFHLARRKDQKQETGSLVGGTLPYLSSQHLESLISDTIVDQSCDIFSLGVVLYECLTGKLPYPTRGTSDEEIRQMILERKIAPPSVRTHNSKIPHDIDSIVQCCLSGPNSGYVNAEQIAHDIQLHLANRPLAKAPNRSLKERATKWVKRHRLLTSTTSISILAMLLVAVTIVSVSATTTRLKRADAENKSRIFSESVSNARKPIELRHVQYGPTQQAMTVAHNVIDARTQGQPEEYRDILHQLPDSLRRRETWELARTEYWLAYRDLIRAKREPDALIQKSIVDNAIQGLDFVVSITRDETPLPLLQMKIDLLKLGGDQSAANLLEEKLTGQTSPETLRDRFLVANEFFRKGNNDKALAELRKLTAEEPRLHQAWMLMGRVFGKRSNFENSELCFSICISMLPSDPWGYIHRGTNYLRQRKFKLANRDFDKAIALAPEEPNSYLNRALCHKALRNNKRALADVDHAIEKGATQTRVHYLRFQILERLDQKELAKQALSTFLELVPTDEISWISRGMAQIKVNRPRLALSDFQSALGLQDNSVAAFQNIATVNAEFLGDTDAAIEALTRILDIEPDNLIARVTRGVLHARKGHSQSAREDAKTVLAARNTSDLLFRTAGIFALNSTSNRNEAIIAVDLLRKAAFRDGRLVWTRMQSDSDLDALRDRDDFRELAQVLSELGGHKPQHDKQSNEKKK